jgi:surfeit locus 1 family protein
MPGAPVPQAGRLGGWRQLVVPAIVTVIAFAILVGLGLWQLERLGWKEALIARVAAGTAADPTPAPGPNDWRSLDLPALEYAPVAVTGRFDHAKEIHVVFTLTEPKGAAGGIGYLVVTPLRTDDGWWAYVNRGFVPRERKEPATRAGGQTEGETTVVGLLRAPHARSWFTPSDNAATNAWFSRDPKLYAATSGLPSGEVAPYLIDARFEPALPGGLPQGGETLVNFSNNHLQYALTWFGLAAALVAIFAAFAVRRLKGGAA